MRKKLQLKHVLTIFNSFIVIIPLIVVSIIAMTYTRSYMIDVSKDYNLQIIYNLKLNLESFFEEPQRDMKTLRDLLETKNQGIDDATIESYFRNQRLFNQLIFVDSQGIVEQTFPIKDDIIGFDYSRRETFRQIQDGQKEAWSRTYIYTNDNRPSINYAVPYKEGVIIGVIDLNAIEELFNKTINDDKVEVGITDQSGVYIMHSDYLKVEQRVTDEHIMTKNLEYTRVRVDSQFYYATSIKTDYQGWQVIIYESEDKLRDQLIRFVSGISIFVLILLLISINFGKRFNKLIFNNLNDVLKKTKDVAEGRYLIDDTASTFEEFDAISQNFKHMANEIKTREDQILNQSFEIELMNKELENRVIERTNELFSTNQELEIALENLKRTQDQLIESEKLASLGDLVAGLAHEINTPLGIILTIITYLQESTGKLKQKYESGTLKKADFESHINTSLESESLIFDNISRAIELISSFKLISAEQRNIEKRYVKLKEFLGNIIKSLEPQMRKVSINVRLHGPDNLEIETIPLSLYQIIINLVINAKLHAYDEHGGNVDISILEKLNHVVIIVEDYGVGISDEHIKKIFEPFFTTKRGTGGTGLGLNIVYNTVRQNLQGQIRCESIEGSGTQFVIELPYKL